MFLFLFFFSVIIHVSGQTNKSNSDLLLLNKLGSSLSKENIEYSDDVSRLLNRYTAKKDTAETDSVDSLEVDSTDSIDTNDLSVYQKLIAGENINPDSMLKEIEVFGYELFNKLQPSTFTPTDAASVPGDYPSVPEMKSICYSGEE